MLRAYPALKILSLTFSTFTQQGTASMYNVAPKSDKYKNKKKTTFKVRCLHMLKNIVNSDTKHFFFLNARFCSGYTALENWAFYPAAQVRLKFKAWSPCLLSQQKLTTNF